MNIWILLSFLSTLLLVYGLDYEQLDIGIWLSSAAYCDKNTYNTMKLGGPVSDFIYKDTIYDIKTDLTGYIGIIPSKKSIYVVIRGSSSKRNWLDDFEIRKVPYPECNCEVHNGFYNSVLNIKNTTITKVAMLKKIYPLYDVIVTGHSYGAACGQLLAMELIYSGIRVKLYNYGQPRVGDQQYAIFVNMIIDDYYRVVHNRDVVPHVPPSQLYYYHSCTELFEDGNGNIHVCSSTNCEDPKCSDQYSIIQTNSYDHETYLGHVVSCEASIVE